MPHNAAPVRVAIDISCAAELPLTGIGYAALHQVRALLDRDEPRLRYAFFGAGTADGAAQLRPELEMRRRAGNIAAIRFLSRARLAKYYAWTLLGWPPIDWFTGRAAIAHNLSHQTPASSRAVRLVTVHDLSPFRFPEMHTPRMVHVQQTLLRHSARTADVLVAVSESCAQEIQDVLGVPADRVRVVPNGVDVNEFSGPLDEGRLTALRAQFGFPHDYWIHLGTLEPRKNIVRLIEAYQQFRRRCSDAPALVLVGATGWNAQPTLDAIAAAAPHVMHVGYLARRDALTLLRGAAACVYPSVYEGFGLPVLEAMAAGVPVITSNTTALPEVGGDAALYVDPLRTESIADALESVYRDREGATRRAALGRARAAHMTWAESAAKLASLYLSLAH